VKPILSGSSRSRGRSSPPGPRPAQGRSFLAPAQIACLDAALDYRSRGLSCIPITRGKKRPAIPAWMQWQEQLPTEHDLRGWFEAAPDCDIALIMGAVSGGLACRDFDREGAYERWKDQYPALAGSLPTQKTGRGFHVFMQLDQEGEARVRRALGKPDGKGAITLPDGELRMGNSYCVAAPSLHANGTRYTWINGLDSLQVIDGPIAAGLLESVVGCGQAAASAAEYQRVPERAERPERPDDMSLASLASLVPLEYPGVRDVLRRCSLTARRQRHGMLFELARELLAIEGLADCPAMAFRLVVDEWRTQSLPFIQDAISFDENWMDFLEGFGKVRFPKGQEPTIQVIKSALALPVPPEGASFDDPVLRQLTTICGELQRHAGQDPFFLSSRLAAEHLYPGLDPEQTRSSITKRLRHLDRLGLIRKVFQGSASNGRANRYRYLGELPS